MMKGRKGEEEGGEGNEKKASVVCWGNKQKFPLEEKT
jgi:hypothetical protein